MLRHNRTLLTLAALPWPAYTWYTAGMADTTTARIYTSDAPRLQRLQFALHAKEGQMPTVAEVIHRLIDTAEGAGQ